MASFKVVFRSESPGCVGIRLELEVGFQMETRAKHEPDTLSPQN